MMDWELLHIVVVAATMGKVRKNLTKRSETMAITRSKQNWSIGATVKVGFLTLRVLSVEAVVDGMPDIYTLESLDGSKLYEFIPHNGLNRIG
jgi:hypothetical protein